jgi:hypothetical protein
MRSMLNRTVSTPAVPSNGNDLALISACRYFLSRFRKVKKANGQIISINEVCNIFALDFLLEHMLLLSAAPAVTMVHSTSAWSHVLRTRCNGFVVVHATKQ